MLAYLFWHRPQPQVDVRDYERRLSAFHQQLTQAGYTSAAFRLDRLPFDENHGYEDWYLVADWGSLGDLNDDAVAARPGAAHDAVAELASKGWGGVYRLLQGDPTPPEHVHWMSKPADETYTAFIGQLGDAAVWQRQLVLGPAPEFCVADGRPSGRRRVWPAA